MEATLLRVLACGSVDDGKSTLIGRLLHDTGGVLDDQAAALARDSRRHGTTGDEPDLALLTDGLQAEREQGITIDVAYRYVTTPARRLIIADAPGHEQYTRNMATGASTADVAVVLVDARHGIQVQTRRHSLIAALLGVRHAVLAVNKMDLVGFDHARFEATVAEYQAFAAGLGFRRVTAIPVCARAGDNVVYSGTRMGWYAGPPLLGHLETLDAAPPGNGPFRMPVQWVNRPDADFRGICGTVAAGQVAVGDRVAPAGRDTVATVRRIIGSGMDQATAGAGDAITLVLDDVDVSRGDVLADPAAPPGVADQFQAHLVWTDTHPLITGRGYLFRIGTATVPGSVTRIRHRLDVNTGAKLNATQLDLNDVAVVNVALHVPVPYAPFRDSRALGGFVMVDRATNATSGAGMVDYALARAANLHWQGTTVDKATRAAQKRQRPAVVWFTGLSGAGKTTVANLVEARLLALGLHTTLAGRRQPAPRAEPGPGLHRGRPRGERPPRRPRGRPDGGRRAGRAGVPDLPLPRRPRDGARPGRAGGVPGGVRGHHPGRVPPPRREGPVRQGRRRPDPQLHRCHRALRVAGRPGAAPVHRRPHGGGAGRRRGGTPAGRIGPLSHIQVMSLLGALFVSACSVVGIRTGTEEPRYEVVDRVGDAEVRTYAPRLAAETVVPGAPDAARGEGFRRLAGYIFGGNAGGSRIAMTAPVAQSGAAQSGAAPSGQRIEMTVPVAQAQAGAEGWSIRFFLPADLSDPPTPRDARVRIVTVPGETVAVLRFPGVASDRVIAAQRAHLLATLAPAAWTPAGPPVTWFYDPPWTLPPLRRNEVAVPVSRRAP